MKNNHIKYPNFQLNWIFHDKDAFPKTMRVIHEWIRKHESEGTTKDMRIRDMFTEIDPEMYDSFSRGDKCRIGKAFSILYDMGYCPELSKGEKKGATNTYHL